MPAPPDVHAANKPPVNFTQEVRFAVVMYGGSSLAIYINGVAQELLRLVRSTAPRHGGDVTYLADEELQGSERVYRKLGRLLERGVEPPQTSEVVKDGAPIRTRFVIDILTGTSAGGINAVFLAKALANDQPLDELKRLWITQGDVGVLLNDKKSDEGVGLGGQDPPGSLLNSRRMYLKLLEALRGMDEARPVVVKDQKSPLVDELDLFVTATDMNGRVIPLRLADGVVHERRHRSVFRFRYFIEAAGGEHRNDFLAPYNPFLAFAARCTSAHQAAFEVMRLVDIEPALRKWPRKGVTEYGAGSEELKEFYKDYIPPAGGADDGRTVPFPERSFSDGGVLDNSPFSFASDALPFRHTDAPVDRKLIYIEPSPEHHELEEESAERPDFFKNIMMALSTLPRYQTIVEDLMRVLERNRLIERTSHIVLGLEDDLKWKQEHFKGYKEPPRLDNLMKDPRMLLQWAMDKRDDLSWGGYQRLRAAEVTDDLTLLVARAAGFDEESDEFTAIRYLVREWRDASYESTLPTEEEKEMFLRSNKVPQAKFILLFDMMWLVRRLKFVLTKINEISCFDARAWQVLEAARKNNELRVSEDANQDGLLEAARKKSEPRLWQKDGKPDEALRRKMRDVLRDLKRKIAAAFTDLRVARRTLWSRGEENPFRPYIVALDVGSEDLLELLKQPNDKARRKYATENLLDKRLGEDPVGNPEETGVRHKKMRERMRAVLSALSDEDDKDALSKLLNEGGTPATRREAIAALTKKVEAELRAAMGKARGRCTYALAEGGGPVKSAVERTLRETLWYYYRHFDEYDQVAYPILHSTGAGEELDPVEVFRISPEDAPFLIDEKKKKVHKLAGTTLGHFGAFFEERFRYNDIMWGRLDTAERIIHALLPNESHKTLRDELTAEAQRAILIEEVIERRLTPQDKAELRRLVNEELNGAGGGDSAGLAASLAEKLKSTGINPSLKGFLHTFLEKVDPLDKFRFDFEKGYEAERAFTPRDTVVNAGRASRILGRMIEGIAESHRRSNKLVLWFARLTRWSWGLVQVAIPETIPNLVTRHLLRVLYLFEAVLIFFGLVFASKEVQRFGLIGLALTATFHVVLLLVGDYIRGGAPTEGDEGGRAGAAAEKKAKKKSVLPKLFARLALVLGGVVALTVLLYLTNEYWLPQLLDFLINELKERKDSL